MRNPEKPKLKILTANKDSVLKIEKISNKDIFLSENLGFYAFVILCGAFADKTFLIPKCHKEDHPIKRAFVLFGLGVSPFMTLCDLYGGQELEIKPLIAYEQLRLASFLISPQNDMVQLCKNATLAIKKTGVAARKIRVKKRVKKSPYLLEIDVNHLIKFTKNKE